METNFSCGEYNLVQIVFQVEISLFSDARDESLIVVLQDEELHCLATAVISTYTALPRVRVSSSKCPSWSPTLHDKQIHRADLL